MPAAVREREGLLREVEAWLETPMLVLSGVWLVLLIVELTGRPPGFVATLTTVIWVIFIAEFLLRFVLAPRKLRFLARNVITVVALIVPAFRLLRAARALRLLRLARGARGLTFVKLIGGANRSMHALRRAMRRRGLGYVLALSVVICVLGALGMRLFEAGGPSDEHFRTFGDSLWWTAMIMTTLGSAGWPATGEGRLLAFLLSFYAFAVFGYIAGALASFFVDRDRKKAPAPPAPELRAELKALRREVRALARPPGPKAE